MQRPVLHVRKDLSTLDFDRPAECSHSEGKGLPDSYCLGSGGSADEDGLSYTPLSFSISLPASMVRSEKI